MQPNTIKWMLAADSDYEKILNKNPEKAIENYDDLKPFENRCLKRYNTKKISLMKIRKKYQASIELVKLIKIFEVLL